MRYYFINTDAKSLGGHSPHDRWLASGFAFTGGPIEYGRKLGRLQPGDVLLVYANGMGVVAVGTILDGWNGTAHRVQMVYVPPHQCDEYRIRVDWSRDLRDTPVPPKAIKEKLGWNPSSALQELRQPDAAKMLEIIERWAT